MEGDSRPELSSDLSGVVLKTSNLASSRSLKLTSTPSGKLTPRASALNSPSFRRSSSFRAHKKVETREGTRLVASTRWISGLCSRRNVVPWLLLIGVWSYVVFLLQYRWVAGTETTFGLFGSRVQEDPDLRTMTIEHSTARHAHNLSAHVTSNAGFSGQVNGHVSDPGKVGSKSKSKTWSRLWPWREKRAEQLENSRHGRPSKRIGASEGKAVDQMAKPGTGAGRQVHEDVKSSGTNDEYPMVLTGDPAQGKLVGPFDDIDSTVVGSAAKKLKRCRRNGSFPKFVKDKTVIVVLHELSMTGAPLAMMELAEEMLSCKAKVSAVVLSRKGGLYQELTSRGIKVIGDKSQNSWKVAAKADLVVAGSAACSSWIGPYLTRNPEASGRLVWWIMENRREYFDRAKLLLNRVRALAFISESQAQLWRHWSLEEKIELQPTVAVVPLSISDDLAILAGVGQSGKLNGTLTIDIAEEMAEKRRKMRFQVRRAMGIDPDDLLAISLSSITPAKGQYQLVLAALMVAEDMDDDGLEGLAHLENVTSGTLSTSMGGAGSRGLTAASVGSSFKLSDLSSEQSKASTSEVESVAERKGDKQPYLQKPNPTGRTLQAASNAGDRTLRILIGSVGSKSNKVPYVEKIVGVVSRHSSLANKMFWTKASVHVAPLYAAADAYVMNAQGIGETFGRVTIEAMAFGLPVLGTNAGGTREIVEDNVTGLLHPVGREGVPVLAQQLRRLLDKPSLGKELGQRGKEKVELLYREAPMYEKLARLFSETEEGPT